MQKHVWVLSLVVALGTYSVVGEETLHRRGSGRWKACGTGPARPLHDDGHLARRLHE